MTATTDRTPPQPAGPDASPVTDRILTPDLARGLMLLMIVISNVGFHFWPATGGASSMNPAGGSLADQVVQFAKIVLLDLRSFPVFAFLFGYGIAQIWLRRTSKGESERDVMRYLRRRSLWLVLFGLSHATLLMGADILGAYGVLSLILGWLFLRRTDRTVLIGAAALTVAFGLLPLVLSALGQSAGGAIPTGPDVMGPGVTETHPLVAAGARLTTGLFITFFGGLPWSFPMSVLILIGFWAARRRVLEEPGRQRRLLRWTAVVGLATCWLGALPLALAHLGWLQVPPAMLGEDGLVTRLHEISGIGGVGYVAVFALAVLRMSDRTRQSVPVVAIAAVGKRSMSSYLTHSLLFAPLLAAWGLGLGRHLGSGTAALFAVGVWLPTVVGAYALERAGRRGPAEVALKRLIGNRARTPTADPSADPR